jgi:hypothetical protein
VVVLVLALGACGRKEEPSEAAIDLAAIRARRDSLRQVAAKDSVARVTFTACADSVQAALEKAAKAKAKSKKKTPAKPVTDSTGAVVYPPEVTTACGAAPAAKPAPVTVAKADSTAKPAATPAAPDTSHAAPTQAEKAPPAKDTGAARKTDSVTTAPPPAAAQAPALTPKQQQVLRADSIRKAREQARADSLAQAAIRAHEDSLGRAQRDSSRAESLKLARETDVQRETFTYSGGSRDPFLSLISEDKLGPEFGDLLLVGVYLDLRRASNSIAVLRDKSTQKRYKLRVGDRLGRLKVAQIRQTDVVFTVEDIGFERQETLSLKKKEDQTP